MTHSVLVVRSGQWFCTSETFGDVWRHSWLSQPGWGCSWYLISKDLVFLLQCTKQPPNRKLSGLHVYSVAVRTFDRRCCSFPHLPMRNWDSVVMWLSAVTQLVSSGSARDWVLTTVLNWLVTSPLCPSFASELPSCPWTRPPTCPHHSQLSLHLLG